MAATDIEEGPDDSLTGIFQFYQPATVSAEGIETFAKMLSQPKRLQKLAETLPASIKQFLEALLTAGQTDLVAKAFAIDRVVYDLSRTPTGAEFVAITMSSDFTARQQYKTLMAGSALAGLVQTGYTDFILDTLDTLSKPQHAGIYGKANDGSAILQLSYPLYGKEGRARMTRILDHLVDLTPAQKASVWSEVMKADNGSFSESLRYSGMDNLKAHDPAKFNAFKNSAETYIKRHPATTATAGHGASAGAPEVRAQ